MSKVMTIASSCEWWTLLASLYVNVMACSPFPSSLRIVQKIGRFAPPSDMSFLTWKIALLRSLIQWLLFLQVGVVTTLLSFPSTSRLCDIVQENFSIFLALWDSLFVTSNQNTRLCHVYNLCGSGSTYSYYACWDPISFFPAISRMDRPWFA